MVKKTARLFGVLVGFLLLLGCEKIEESPPEVKRQLSEIEQYVESKCSRCHFSSPGDLTMDGEVIMDRPGECNLCHSPHDVYQKPRTPEEWTRIIRKMSDRKKGWITAEEEKKILEFFISSRSICEKVEEGKEKGNK